jgi:hypothetical protein
VGLGDLKGGLDARQGTETETKTRQVRPNSLHFEEDVIEKIHGFSVEKLAENLQILLDDIPN